jgi:hypothetical protein
MSSAASILGVFRCAGNMSAIGYASLGSAISLRGNIRLGSRASIFDVF